MLYKLIELPSDDPVQFVGVDVLRWGKQDEPTVGFRPATADEIRDANELQDLTGDVPDED